MKVASRESEVRSQAACLTLTKEGFKRFRASSSIRPFDFDPVKLKFCKRFRKRLEEEKGYRLPYSPLMIEVDFFEYLINALNDPPIELLEMLFYAFYSMFDDSLDALDVCHFSLWSTIKTLRMSEMINMPLCHVPKNIQQIAADWIVKLG
ncbi:uncharacterized protein LOC18431828 [Amborella trichopoda]|uniref:uncharacterized protein LOC18431828 n=1 Tax=Amborella trichopoda TaxID=13333 RepID=UPI0009C1145D|nr:uncharacterized protein LOC18431828 [Amborella trichopoda]|eukprot:XP_020521401.1 uncharacterized protein LOC18431828 [Amborella trichopoda]